MIVYLQLFIRILGMIAGFEIGTSDNPSGYTLLGFVIAFLGLTFSMEYQLYRARKYDTIGTKRGDADKSREPFLFLFQNVLFSLLSGASTAFMLTLF